MEYTVEEYIEDWDTIHWQEGFSGELKGLTIEEQLKCYAWTTFKALTEIPYKDLESRCREKDLYLNDIEQVEVPVVLVKDGKVVGVKITSFFEYSEDGKMIYEYESIKPYECYCYSSTSDNNGAGYKETNWYKYLICLPADHTLW